MSVKTCFTGTYQNSIDSKNRMIVPAKYRTLLDGRCVLAMGYDECLYIYPMEEWENIVEKFDKLKRTKKVFRDFIRQYFSTAEICNIDAQGRILIAQKFKNYAHIEKDIVIKGALEKIEVWAAGSLDDPDVEDMMNDPSFLEMLDAYDI